MLISFFPPPLNRPQFHCQQTKERPTVFSGLVQVRMDCRLSTSLSLSREASETSRSDSPVTIDALSTSQSSFVWLVSSVAPPLTSDVDRQTSDTFFSTMHSSVETTRKPAGARRFGDLFDRSVLVSRQMFVL